MKIYKDINQGSPEWFEIRVGKVTASHAQAIGNNGKGLENYILEVVAEMFSSSEKEHYSNEHTERGNELEPIARSMYELQNDVEVEEIGFAEYNDFVGCSPDGLVGKDGMIEIKCPDDKTYFNLLMNEKIDNAYIWQCQMNMLILERKWCDLVFYNPNFEKSMKIFRLEPDKEMFSKLKEGFEKAEAEITRLVSKYKEI
ncbi:MAG: Exonuclease [Parcubacteria bacterium 32_520]|jgi:putative phage-type endonuclease|nr:MAG: Exonuclease [Parcubacteria bacterium 32_520]